jgi:hypothetical protein
MYLVIESTGSFETDRSLSSPSYNRLTVPTCHRYPTAPSPFAFHPKRRTATAPSTFAFHPERRSQGVLLLTILFVCQKRAHQPILLLKSTTLCD